MKGLILTLTVVAALAVAGCGSSGSSSSSSTQSTEAASAISTDLSKKPKVVVPEGSAPTKLVENEVVEGSGAEAKSGDQVIVQYVGVDFKNGKEFDASWGREPFTFTLGNNEVIAGWDQGVAGMKVGGRRELVIPPELAYGPEGRPPVIPPNETLVFVIDLLSIK